MVICVCGVLCAAWPLLDGATFTPGGLGILLGGMLAYSGVAIYFSRQQWNRLHLLAVNGWQTAIGGLMLLPFAIAYYDGERNRYDMQLWGAVLWLALPVSIVTVQFWLWLLRANAARAGMGHFLCPVFDFAIARWLVHDKLSAFTVAGVLLVITGLGMAQKSD